MNKTSVIDCYFYYMWNAWSLGECNEVFGESLGKHIWYKWNGICCDIGANGAPAALYAVLDGDCRDKLVDHAFKHYNK